MIDATGDADVVAAGRRRVRPGHAGSRAQCHAALPRGRGRHRPLHRGRARRAREARAALGSVPARGEEALARAGDARAGAGYLRFSVHLPLEPGARLRAPVGLGPMGHHRRGQGGLGEAQALRRPVQHHAAAASPRRGDAECDEHHLRRDRRRTAQSCRARGPAADAPRARGAAPLRAGLLGRVPAYRAAGGLDPRLAADRRRVRADAGGRRGRSALSGRHRARQLSDERRGEARRARAPVRARRRRLRRPLPLPAAARHRRAARRGPLSRGDARGDRLGAHGGAVHGVRRGGRHGRRPRRARWRAAARPRRRSAAPGAARAACDRLDPGRQDEQSERSRSR